MKCSCLTKDAETCPHPATRFFVPLKMSATRWNLCDEHHSEFKERMSSNVRLGILREMDEDETLVYVILSR